MVTGGMRRGWDGRDGWEGGGNEHQDSDRLPAAATINLATSEDS